MSDHLNIALHKQNVQKRRVWGHAQAFTLRMSIAQPTLPHSQAHAPGLALVTTVQALAGTAESMCLTNWVLTKQIWFLGFRLCC